MANLSRVKFRTAFDVAAAKAVLDRVNADRFGGRLTIEAHASSVQVTTAEGSRIWFWMGQPGLLEWKTQVNDGLFWLSETLAAHLVRAINPRLRITNEGISEKLEPNFDQRYPTLDAWMTGKYKPKR